MVAQRDIILTLTETPRRNMIARIHQRFVPSWTRRNSADKGTLFLDEVGDIPLALQPKLLRVLQEQEFERLGSTRTRQMDVRLVAATNRDLTEMVKRGEFRSDLYYRLNVFPIRIPPLRERREDIPLLVQYFTQKYARRISKRIETELKG